MNGMSKSYEGVSAKAHAVYGRMLTDAQFELLAKRNSITEVVAVLKGTERYEAEFKTVNELRIHRGQVEELLRKSVFGLYLRLSGFIPGAHSGFSRFFVRKAEVDALANTMLFAANGQYGDIVSYIPSYIGEHASFNLMDLAKIRSGADILTVLAGTIYEKQITVALEGEVLDISDAANVNRLREVALFLRTEYLRSVLQDIGSEFDGVTGKKLTDAVNTRIDLLNLLSAYRLRSTFKVQPAVIRSKLNAIGRAYNKVLTGELLDSPDADEQILEEMRGRYFGQGVDLNVSNIDLQVRQYFRKMYTTLLMNAADGGLAMFALLHLLEIEQQNVTAIIEGIRYALPVAEIENLLTLRTRTAA